MRRANASDTKIKREEGEIPVIKLEKNPDIAKALGEMKRPGQVTVGFALETNNESHNAQAKLNRKNLDFIVLNSLRDKGAGFRTDTNKVTIIHRDGTVDEGSLKPKSEVARDIVDALVSELNKNQDQ